MKVTGTATLNSPIEKVWAALNDPAVLVRTIPGCQRLETVGPDAYRMTLNAGVASVHGTYHGDVRLTDQQAPDSFVLKASGAGAPGTVSADVRIMLFESGDGRTRLDYDADALVGGMIGGVGQRLLAGVAKKTAGEFFTAVDEILRGTPVAHAAETAGGAVYEAPEAAHAATPDFAKGVAVGAAAALLGALVGGRIARRRSG